MRALILLIYCQRPRMVLNALKSVRDQNHDDWELAIIDDTAREFLPRQAIANVLFDVFPEAEYLDSCVADKYKYDCWVIPETNKVITVYTINDTLDMKKNSSSRHGEFMNLAMREAETAKFGIMLCDDDALYPSYLKKVNQFFLDNSYAWGYGHVTLFDPNVHSWPNIPTGERFNSYTEPIEPPNRLDASQVAWRLECNREGGAWFEEGRTKANDYYFYRNIFRRYGYCHFMDCLAQYKGWYLQQLSNRHGDQMYEGDFDIQGKE